MSEKIKIEKGLFIVLYGVNGVGKTTQLEKLAKWLSSLGYVPQRIKFPLFDLSPTGPRIDRYLHGDKKGGATNPENLDVKVFQELCAENRRDAEPILKEWLSEGCIVIAEDWTYGGIVWGIATGVPEKEVYFMNEGFLEEDIRILIDCTPFMKERRHYHEEKDSLIDLVRFQYLNIAQSEGWPIVNGKQDKLLVHNHITDIVKPFLPRRL